VATYFQTLFNQSGAKAQAQTLAVALNIYATTSSLGGKWSPAYGFTVTAWGLGAYSYNVGSDGAAFGVPNNSTRNVFELLLAVNNKAVKGVLYNGNTTLQSEAADLFTKTKPGRRYLTGARTKASWEAFPGGRAPGQAGGAPECQQPLELVAIPQMELPVMHRG
jgi:hypothetical protein